MNDDALAKSGSSTINAADDLLAALADKGVDYVFANSGTDFPSLIESFAKAAAGGGPAPTPVTVPHENVAVSMAHGYYLATGKPAAVMLHVNVGTANAICGLINAARDNVPVLLAAGRTPVLEDGPLGARSVYIHWGQEMFDQAGMLREVVKWEYELRRPEQVRQVVSRALSVAMSQPRGPVYLTLPREVLATETTPAATDDRIPAATPAAPDVAAIAEAAAMIGAGKKVLLITANYGQDQVGVAPLAALAERHGIGVIGYRPRYMFLPNTHPNHIGYEPGPLLPEADVVIALDCDVPFVPKLHKPNPDARFIQIGADPLFQRYPMRTFPADLAIAANSTLAVEALAKALDESGGGAGLDARRAWVAEKNAAHRAETDKAREAGKASGAINAATVADALDAQRRPDDAVVVETVFPAARLTLTEPGTYYGNSSAGGLGWGLGAALGLKLGHKSNGRDRRVIAIVGDGAYMFGNPTPAHFVSASLDLPILVIILNNKMWGAVRRATLSLYPDGAAARSNQAPLTLLEPAPDYEKIVEASGGVGIRVETLAELPDALKRGLEIVEGGKTAVLNVMVAYSDQAALADSRR